TIIEAMYADGVLKPLVAADLKEQQRYRLFLEEIKPLEPVADPEMVAEIERRTTVLPDGRKIVRLGGIWADYLPAIPKGADPVKEALEEMRRERASYLEAELDELYPPSMEQ